MPSTIILALSSALLALLCVPAAAEPVPGDGGDLKRNGAVSRRLWTSESTTTEVAGARLSAGLALGLHDSLRRPLGSRVAPALTLDLDRRSNLSLLSLGSRGAMLVWQRSN